MKLGHCHPVYRTAADPVWLFMYMDSEVVFVYKRTCANCRYIIYRLLGVSERAFYRDVHISLTIKLTAGLMGQISTRLLHC